MMNWIVDNWFLLIAIIALLSSLAYIAYGFIKMPNTEQLTKVKEWLLYAVTMAETELGSGTGKLKLRYVYDMFVGKFTWLAEVITFEQFNYLVDDALEEMKKMLETNIAVQKLVIGTDSKLE